MSEKKRIPEAEFTADLNQGLLELAVAIKESGLSIAAIARATRTHWETVYHASHGIPIRYDNARRIMYYINSIRNEHHTDPAR